MDGKHRRGWRESDENEFSPAEVEKLKKARADLHYLLDRGYPMKGASVFVSNHYQLTVRQSLAAVRCTAPSRSLRSRENKRLLPRDMAGKTMYIDGFNLIIGLEVALSGGMLLVGMDGCIRDLAELRGTYRIIPHTKTAICIIRDICEELQIAKAVFFLDEPVSNSGRLKQAIAAEEWHMPLDIQVVRSPDALLKGKARVVTGDSAILDCCESWFNMMAYAMETREELHKTDRLVRLDKMD